MRQSYVVLTTAASAGLLAYAVTRATLFEDSSAPDPLVVHSEDAPPWQSELRQNRAETRWLKGSHAGLNDELSALRRQVDDLKANATSAASHAPPEAQVEEPRSEGAFAEWLDEVLVANRSDQRTRLVEEGLQKLAAHNPNLTIDDTLCSERVCRASISAVNGEMPSVASLLGNSTLASAGFTIGAADGVMEVYFTPPGESFEGLRDEAFAALEAPLR